MSELPANLPTLEEVADRFLAALRARESPDRVALVAAHPTLAPKLDARLALIEHLFELGRDELPPQASTGPPAKIGRFEILGLLGRGAFGMVYKARDPELDRSVAIKVPRTGSFATPEEEARFLREARSAGSLKHPSIVSVHEIGHDGELPYIVSDWIDGQTLAERIQFVPPAWRWSAEICIQIAAALEHAHEQKIVHRDVKPQNILLDASDRAHVTDFGLAHRDEGDATVTVDGQILGTPAYMSPEQAAGEHEKVGARSDVYSLGVVLYELLTGERPFRGSKSRLIQQVLHDEPRPPRSLNDRIPADLETICLKAMAKEPSRRYATARSLAEDLGRFLVGEPIRARPVGQAERLWRWAKRKPVIATLSAVVALLLMAIAVMLAVGILQVTKARDAVTAALGKSEERLVRLSVANGTRLLDDGDVTGALVWFTEALRLQRPGSAEERAHRLRIGTVLTHCSTLERVWLFPAAVVQAVWSPDGELMLAVSDSVVSVLAMDTGRNAATLQGHTGRVTHAAFSPDSGAIVTASADGTSRVWDVASGNLLCPPLVHGAGVNHVLFSPDGLSIATAAADKTARVWRAATGESLLVLKHTAAMNKAIFSPDGARLATTSESFSARLWEVSSGKLTATLRHRSYIMHVEFSPDGSRLVTASRDQAVQIWSVATGEPLGPPLLHDLAALHATFSPDGRRLATTSYAITARVWDAWTGEPFTPRIESRTYLDRMEFRPDGQLLLSSGIDGSVRFWDPATGKQVGSPLQHARRVRSASFSPNGRWVLTSSDDGTVRLWNTASGRKQRPPLEHQGPISGADFGPEGRWLVTASNDRTAQLWETESGERIGAALLHEDLVLGAELSADGRWVLTASKDGARLWDARLRDDPSWKVIYLLKLPGGLLSARFSPDGRLIAATGSDGTVQIWSSSTGAVIGAPMKHTLECRSAAFSPDGRSLVTGSHDWTAQIWEVQTGSAVGSRMKQESAIHSVAFSPDGLLVATANDDGVARVWNAVSGEPTTPPLPHLLRVERVAFSPNSRHLLSASFDATAQVWEATTGKPASPRLAQGGMLRDAVFSRDGALVATASGDGSARVWDWPTGEPITPLLRHSDRVDTVRFHPSSQQLLTASLDGTARLWDLRADERSIEDLLLISRVLSGRQISAAGSLVVLDGDEFRAAWEQHDARRLGDSAPATEANSAWHHRQAIDAAKAGEWTAVLWHLDRLSAAARNLPEAHVRRARALAALGIWEAAAVEYDLGEKVKHGGHDVHLVYENALVRLKTGDLDGYRIACEPLVAWLGGSPNPGVVNQAAWTCVLGPGALRDLKLAVEAAKKALAASPNKLEFRNTTGAALYRAGDADGAIADLKESVRLEGRGGTVWDWLFLAMANRHAGRDAEARAWLAKATAFAGEASPAGGGKGGVPARLDWKRRAELEILLEEARRVVEE